MMKKTSLFGISFRRCGQVFIEPVNLNFFSISGWDTDLDHGDIEWFALEMNQDDSVAFFNCIAFWTLFLTMMATSFLLRDSCPQW